MTDINRAQDRLPPMALADLPDAEVGLERLTPVVELLFFAYRDFTGESDKVLKDYHFGRAHHRVLHFVTWRPGLRVADLLDILKITKQSLARVLKQLIDRGFVTQEAGQDDRRERRLFATTQGIKLAERLRTLQTRRIASALDQLEPAARPEVLRFLLALTSDTDRAELAHALGHASLKLASVGE